MSTWPHLSAEVWLARRMSRPDLFSGVTTHEVRRERLRREIEQQGIAGDTCGMQQGRRTTYAQAFERLYGEPLGAAA